MYTRADYIEAVKVKLEEVSPFTEPDAFIADGDASVVKPILSYIDKTLDEAARNCLRGLPLSLLHADIEHVTSTGASAGIAMAIDSSGIGRFSLSQSIRPVRFRHDALKRDITSFITTEDSLYLLQQKEYTRGGTAKPVAVWSSNDDQMEIYSFPKSMATPAGQPDTTAVLLGINTYRKPGVAEDYDDPTPVIQSPIEDLIVLECAAMVAQILRDADKANGWRQEQAAKIQAQLQ